MRPNQGAGGMIGTVVVQRPVDPARIGTLVSLGLMADAAFTGTFRQARAASGVPARRRANEAWGLYQPAFPVAHWRCPPRHAGTGRHPRFFTVAISKIVDGGPPPAMTGWAPPKSRSQRRLVLQGGHDRVRGRGGKAIKRTRNFTMRPQGFTEPATMPPAPQVGPQTPACIQQSKIYSVQLRGTLCETLCQLDYFATTSTHPTPAGTKWRPT